MKKLYTLLTALLLCTFVWGDAGVNVAANKSTKSGWSRLPDTGTSPNAGEVSGKAVDQDLNSKYISYGIGSNASRAWWAVDLGTAYRLNSINVVWNNNRTPSHYLIQVMTETPSDFVDDVEMSDDGWETVLEIRESQVEGTGGNHYDFGAITARYIRLVPKDRREIGLNEFEVYADALDSDPITTPTLTASSLQSDLSDGSATLTLTATDHNSDPLHTFLIGDQTGKFYRVTTDDSDHATISGLSNRRYAFTIWAIEDGCLSATSQTIIVGANTFDADENIGLNKPSYAIRYRANDKNYAPSKANDGSLSTHWNAGSDGGEAIAEEDQNKVWWYVDLQDQYELKYISLFYTNAYATSIIMQIRKDAPTIAQANDDSTWETFLEYSGTPKAGNSEDKANLYGDITGAVQVFSKATKGRYVRFRAVGARNWSWGVQVREIRIYGNGYLPLDNEKPVISTASYNGTTVDRTGLKFNITASDNLTSANELDYFVVDPNLTEHAALYDDGVLSVTGMPTFKNGNISIFAMDEAGNRSDEYVIENLSYVHPTDNLAELKTTWVSYTNNQDDEKQANLNDGILNSKGWIPYHNSGKNAWMVLDLGDTYLLNTIQAFFATGRRSTNYKIYGRQNDPSTDDVRGDNTQWIELAAKSSDINAGNTEEDVNESAISWTGAIRYVRFESFAEEWSDANNGFKLLEFRVFGKAFATPDNDAPVISAASYNGVTADYTGLKFNITVSDNVTTVEDLVYTVEDPEGVEHEATYNEGVITVTGMPTFKNEDITLYAYDAVPNKSEGYVVANVSYVNPTDNLAENQTRYGCITYNNNENEGPAKANDGNTNTHWTSYTYTPITNEWWYVDLGDFYDIRRIEVVWKSGYHSTNYSIQYRQNAPEGNSGATASEWDTFTEFTNMSGDQAIDITNTQAQYICMRSSARNEGGQLRLAELRVFGKSFASADANPPIITTAYVSYNDDKAYLNLQATDVEDGEITTFRVTNVTNSTTETLTTDANNQIVISGLTLGTQYTFEVEAVDNADNHSDAVELIVNVPYPTSTNIAPYGTATAGYNNPGNSGEHANKVNDNLENTKWTTYNCNDADDRWVEIELDAVYHLTKIAVLWNDASHYAKKYTIKTRVSETDDWNVFPQISLTLTESGELVETNADVIAKYVRVVVDEQYYWANIHELRVYADAKVLSLSDAEDNSTVISANNGWNTIVTLNRGFIADGGNYTLVLPFDMTAEQCEAAFGAGYQLWYLSDSRIKENGDIYLNFVSTSSIVAGRPYLFCPAADVASGAIISDVHINSTLAPSVTAQASFIGTYDVIPQATISTTSNAYLLGGDNWLYEAQHSSWDLKALRAYFTLNFTPVNGVAPRIRVVYNESGAGVSTDLDPVTGNPSPVTQKLLRNGQLIIIRNGVEYNAQGQIIK